MKRGVGYNPRPDLPDPWAVAARLGLVPDESSNIVNWPNPQDNPSGGQFTPGHPEVHAAWMARYNTAPDQMGKFGSERVLTVWPRVLGILWAHGKVGSKTEYDGIATEREATDAAVFGPRTMICEAFVIDGAQGYTAENPIKIKDRSLDTGPHTVTGRKRQGEPASYAQWRDPNGCTLYYLNESGAQVPTPQPTPEPKPTPAPTPAPTPSPTPSPAPAPVPPLFSPDALRTVELLLEWFPAGTGKGRRVRQLAKEIQAAIAAARKG